MPARKRENDGETAPLDGVQHGGGDLGLLLEACPVAVSGDQEHDGVGVGLVEDLLVGEPPRAGGNSNRDVPRPEQGRSQRFGGDAMRLPRTVYSPV